MVATPIESDDPLETDIESEEETAYVDYDIASYPSDLTLSVIHEMWADEDIVIPSFQRNYVWNIKQASLLIESFLMGLPVPQVFFYIDDDNKSLVIDGQQRISSIAYYFEGYFGPENMQGRRQTFRLTGLSEKSPHLGKRFEDLSSTEQRKLKGAVLRAINIKQLAPVEQSTSMYHIFERLNTGGTPLRPQEIRNCVFHGQLVSTLHDLNELPSWRKIIGRKALDRNQRDVEMILRVFAMSDRGASYEKPMKEFLNTQMGLYKRAKSPVLAKFAKEFEIAAEFVSKELPAKPFHVRGPINLAAMDSVLSTIIKYKNKLNSNLGNSYKNLISDQEYRDSIFYNTSDQMVVKNRLEIAKKYLVS